MAAAGKGSPLETGLSQLSHRVPERLPLSHLVLAIGLAVDILYRQHLLLVSRNVSGTGLNIGELIMRSKGERNNFCFLKME